MWFCHQISIKMPCIGLILGANLYHHLFNLRDFPQRAVERGLPVCFLIKIKAGKSVTLCMHTHLPTDGCIYAYAY